MKQKYWSKNSPKKSIQIHTGLFEFFLRLHQIFTGEVQAWDTAPACPIQTYAEESVICVVKFTLRSL